MNSVTTIPLKRIIDDLESGGRPKGGIVEGKGEVFSIGGEHLNDYGGFDFANERRVPIDFFREMKRGKVKPKDVLIVKDGATTGKVSYVPDDFPELPCSINEHVFRLSINPDLADAKYIFYYLYGARGNREIMRDFRGATIGGISQDFVKYVHVPLPSLPEQYRIADILDKADRLRRLRRYALELSDSYLRSVFLEMFYSAADERWPEAGIASVAKKGKDTIRTGPFGSQLKHSEFVEKGIRVLGIDNAVNNRFEWGKPRFITERKFEQLKRYKVYPGDVIITIMATLGRCAIIPKNFPEAINTKHLCCITVDKDRCTPTYLKHCFLTHPSVLRQLGVSERGAIMPGLNMGIIKDLIIVLPPLPLQEKFTRIVNRFECIRSQQQEALRQAEYLFNSLLHQAFQGD